MRFFLITAIAFCVSVFNSSAQYTKLLDFSGTSSGSNPQGSLVSDGTFLYGMSYQGGANDLGTVFKIMPDGSGYATLLDFDGSSNGSYPYGSLIFDGTFLYGMTYSGGTSDLGTIFKIMPDGTNYSKLLDFSGAGNGGNPRGSLLFDGTYLYGLTVNEGLNNLGVLFKIMPDGSNYTNLMDFGGVSNGSNPYGSLISDGTFLYGMTYKGGTNDLGTIFKIKPDGTNYSMLVDCAGAANGSYPLGDLVSDGTFLYGMTYQGGANDMGIIFKVKPDGTNHSVLLDFSGPVDGSYSFGSLIYDGIFLYGMTYQGGANDLGTIFKVKPDGTDYLKIFDFSGLADGSYPVGSLISDGTFLYGMTSGGGTDDLGTIFNYGLPASITMVVPNSLSICTGYTVAVPYNAGGVFNAGNLFIAQLSDATGNFSAPVNLDSLSSTATDTIVCIIPVSTVAGTGYRIRVVSTNPVIVSNDNGTDITINTTPSIVTTTPASRCDAGTVNLGATASAGTLDWYASSSGGTSLGTGAIYTTPSLTLTTTYYVSATDNSCYSARTAVTATVTIITATTPASRCGAGTLTLGAAASGGILNWYASSSGGSSLGTGTSFTTPSISSAITYYVDATNAGCSTLRVSVVATVNSLPSVFSIPSDTAICIGDSITLSGGGAVSYFWTGGVVDGLSFFPLVTDNYTVTGEDGNGCENTFTVEVTVNSLPVITTSGNTTICAGSNTILSAFGGTTYVWNPGGETTAAITVSPTASTTYTVVGTDLNGCSDDSAVTVIIDPCTGMFSEYNPQALIIYPNPSSGFFNIQSFEIGIINVYNAQGKEVFTSSINPLSPINLDLPAGIYYYKLNDLSKIISSGKMLIE